MKNRWKMTLAGMLTFGLVTTGVASAQHIHTPTETWDRNVQEHWRVCECGEKLDIQAHTMDDILCTVCGSEIWIYDDGTADISNYDEQEQLCRNSSYDSDGSMMDDYRYEREYDEINQTTLEKVYYSGADVTAGTWVFIYEELSTTDAEGWYLPIRQTAYYPDGTVESINEYDEYGNLLLVFAYDETGTLVFEEHCEYVYAADGSVLQTTRKWRDVDGNSTVIVTNEYDDTILHSSYAADGSLEYEYRNEYGYDEHGCMLWEKMYDGENLFMEGVYTVRNEEEACWSYLSSNIEYHEDGSKTICEYDEDGWVIRGTEYDKEGNVVHTYELEEEFAVG